MTCSPFLYGLMLLLLFVVIFAGQRGKWLQILVLPWPICIPARGVFQNYNGTAALM